ncbi:transglutaminaseTgpA domain-containing protein [Paenibacillus sp. LPE1-1-1.1]|uniref:transglutaminase family protein n=1 Tax=Paenibacillus sp. LPE1-1-1.1 TaxID=3135230 RepID=UPI00343A0156
MLKLRSRSIPLLRDWHQHLSVLLTGVFLLQYVIWIQKESGVLLPETITVVKMTLLLTLVVEMFPALHWSLRRLMQFMAITFMTGYVLDYDPLGREVSDFRDLGILFQDDMRQFAPFIWFALSAWIITLIALKTMQNKLRIMIILVITVMAFAIRDSFSSIELWEQGAAAIICGLFLLTIWHFVELKKRIPVAWSNSSGQFAFIALPIVLLFSLIVYLGTLAPDVRAVLTDPYTMWRNVQGVSPAMGSSDSASTSLGSQSTSGYSRDDSTLGGQLTFDHTPVMSAVTPYRSYWRGETRSLYTGRGWISSEVERRMPLSLISPEASLPHDPRLEQAQLGTIEVKQTVTMAGDSREEFPVLFGAYAMDNVQSITNGNDGVSFSSIRWSSQSSELRWIGDGQTLYPESYTIVSKVPVINEAALRKVPAQIPSREGLEEYLHLPDTLPNRVTELALQVSQPGTNMYDKVKLLEQYLSSTYPYTTNPDLSKGKSADFVDQFLFEVQEGYCNNYSTAMAVMARSIGIPTRWVKGFAPGAATGENEYTIRNSDAHSWVEVFFPGYGWIPFEPTAGFSLPTYAMEDASVTDPQPETSIETETPTESESNLESEEILQTQKVGEGNSRSFRWEVGIVAGAILLGLIWILRRRVPVLRHIWPVNRQLNTNQDVLIEFELFLRFVSRKGYHRLKHETAREATQRWFEQNKQIGKDELNSVLLLFEKANYSGSSISHEELTEMKRKMQHIREIM